MISDKQKNARYKRLFNQAESLIKSSPSIISAYSTLNALLYHKIPYIFWVGVYLRNEDKLIVSAYQGPLACQILPYPKGICWQCIEKGSTISIPDVHEVKNHIACDSRSQSEIVIPIKNKGKDIIGVLDIDSDQKNVFTEADRIGLEKLVGLLK
jgi:GAF domain-containing protein